MYSPRLYYIYSHNQNRLSMILFVVEYDFLSGKINITTITTSASVSPLVILRREMGLCHDQLKYRQSVCNIHWHMLIQLLSQRKDSTT